MPTIEVDCVELERFLGLTLHGETTKLDEVLAFVKGEVKLYDQNEGVVSIEMKDTNRPDLWGIEGLARALRGFQGLERGLKTYRVGKPIVDVHVDSRLEEISFVPLGFSERMNLKEILERHPKGIEYGHIVKRHNVFPILLDSEKKVLSFPPIINSK